MFIEFIPLLLFMAICALLLLGYPVAFTLAGVSLLFACVGIITGVFDPQLLLATPDRIFGTMINATFVAVPLFIFMGVVLEKSRIAEDLLKNMARLCGFLPGGLAVSVVLVGMFLAASTGIVGATVVTMGLMSLPTMLNQGYNKSLATGTICATGTLGQIIPPSIALVLLGDTLSTANQRANLEMGVFNAAPISVGDLFVGAVVPGFLLVCLYLIYVLLVAWLRPSAVGRSESSESVHWVSLLLSILPPLGLIVLVLGSIIAGIATPTEAAGVGAVGAVILAIAKGQGSLKSLYEASLSTTKTTVMVFTILIGASVFSLVFRGFGGEELVANLFNSLPGGVITATFLVLLVIFLLGFILDFIEITFVVVPLVAPVLLMMGLDPLWLGIMIAINLQTSFLTPPFGFALFYLRGVAPESVLTTDIYKGVLPFVGLQLFLMLVLALFPSLVTWLPSVLAQ